MPHVQLKHDQFLYWFSFFLSWLSPFSSPCQCGGDGRNHFSQPCVSWTNWCARAKQFIWFLSIDMQWKSHSNYGHMRSLAPCGPSMDTKRPTNLLSTNANKYHFQHTGKLRRTKKKNATSRIEAINNDAAPIGGCESKIYQIKLYRTCAHTDTRKWIGIFLVRRK